MDHRTRNIITISTIAAAAAMGVAAGVAARQHRQPQGLLHRGREKLEELGRHDHLERFHDSLGKMLPRGEGVIRRGRRKAERAAGGDEISDAFEKLLDLLPRRDAEHLLERVERKLRH